MRLGVVLQEPWAEDAALAEELGFDLVWIEEREAFAPLVVAAAVGAVTSGIRIVASVGAGVHPVTLAEEAAVADLATGGRLALAVGDDDDELLAETVDVLFQAFAARPFRHEGPRWRIPANLPEHEHAEERVRVTPPPAQLEPTIWLTGAAAPAVGRSRGLSFVSEGGQGWPEAERALGPAAARLRRIGFAAVDVPVEPEPLVQRLLAGREAWGLDVAVLTLSSVGDARREALRVVVQQVRPRLQLNRVPAGLQAQWQSELP
jgi:alkanesulfonate monooxygenase SsuD/methylene tetrahydromethanopterin reductase-like flavin-dependent oxidoreductase (luciferase family)